MTNPNDEIRQANRRALPKFILIVILSCLLGLVTGFFAARLGVEGLADGLRAFGRGFSRWAAPWLLAACAVIEPAACLPQYFAAKRELAAWDGEDEAVSDRVDRRLSIVMWANGTLLICALFLIAAAYSAGFDQGPFLFFLGLAGFVATMAEAIVIQQKLVDLSKRLSPEKQGSVYDLKFQKKWMDSCDEAEKLLIGRCAYKAYSAVSMTCLILWMIFTLTALFLGTGFLPVLAVCVIWVVAQSVYCWWAVKLSSPGAAPL